MKMTMKSPMFFQAKNRMMPTLAQPGSMSQGTGGSPMSER